MIAMMDQDRWLKLATPESRPGMATMVKLTGQVRDRFSPRKMTRLPPPGHPLAK